MKTLLPFRDAASVIPLISSSPSSCSSKSGSCGDASSPALHNADDDAPCSGSLALMLTRRCNMTCGHCSVESGPHVKGEPTREELLERVRGAARGGISGILLTDGEAMLRAPLVLELLRECKRLGLATAMTSNGFWGRDAQKAACGTPALTDDGRV